MGIMLRNTINMGKRPFHSLDTETCLTAGTNKRGKVFSFFPSVKADYSLCHECPTATVTDTTLEQAENPAPRPSVGGSGSDALAPTSDDYANLFFCDAFEEEETRAHLATEQSDDIATSQPCSDHPAVAVAATTTTTTTTIITAISTPSTREYMRRRVSFGASIPTFHLLQNVPPAHAMTPDERSTLWFSRGDLEMLKSSAQSSIQEMRNRIVGNAHAKKDRSKFRSMMVTLESETNSSIRGLEHRVFRRKQTRKMMIRDVLECQAHVRGLAKFGHKMDGEEESMLLAKVSRERSLDARSLAFVNAKDDHEEVYVDDDATDVDARM
mmetsp:Transcript_31027/g.56274  ORF Transcript_31027/g.56274 Transcript_31027/m.56274 type:complete len:326 (-) Transcript_31027:1389-2366(-)